MTDSIQPYRLKPQRTEKHPSRRKNNRSNNGNPPAHNPTGIEEVRNRIEALEKALPDIRERLVRVETKLDCMAGETASKTELADLKIATKSDFADLKAAMLEGFHSQTKWFVGTAVVFAGVALAAMRLLQ